MESGCRVLYIDGLCTTHEKLGGLIGYISNHAKNCAESCMITVHEWKEDRETCVKNDYKRRSTESLNTILNAPYDAIKSADVLKSIAGSAAEKFLFRIHKHIVVEKPARKFGKNHKEILRSITNVF